MAAPADGADSGGPVRRITRAVVGMVPAPCLVLVGIGSVQCGSAVAKTLFAHLPPPGVVLLRMGFAALLLLPQVGCRRGPDRSGPGLRGRRDPRDAALAAALGLAIVGTTLAFYEALDRIPLGVAVTVEFCGPLAVAVAGSRRWRDAAWVVMAGLGVILLTRADGGVTLSGVALAALAGTCWACYILLTAAVGRRFEGTSGLAAALLVATVVALPFGVATSGATLLSARVLVPGAGVALLSSLIPYTVELHSLRRIPAQTFGLLMSLEPAMAALVGFAVLGEVLSAREWLAIGLVVAACVGATRPARS